MILPFNKMPSLEKASAMILPFNKMPPLEKQRQMTPN
jgi:hypothetical protein